MQKTHQLTAHSRPLMGCCISSNNLPYEKVGKNEPVCIADEVPFEIPDSWEWVRLGSISTYSETKQKINAANANPELWGLDLEDIERGGRLIAQKTVGERKAIGDKTLFSKGDILYSKLRPYLLKILVAPDDGICTPEIVPFRVYGGIEPNYIVNYLKSPYVESNQQYYLWRKDAKGRHRNNDLPIGSGSPNRRAAAHCGED